MMKMIGSVALAIAAVGCMKKSTGAGGGGETTSTAPAGGSVAFAGTMAEAPVFEAGATVTAAVPCSRDGSGYAKFNFPVGQALQMNVTVDAPAGACLSVSYLKANGGAVDGMMKEMCVDRNASETWDVQGLEGGSFIQVNEAPPCKGATITIAAQ
jgi:hypothetical protein